MPRIIIDYDAEIPAWQAAKLVSSVIAQGMISEARGIEKFCHLTKFRDHAVHVRDRRHEDAAHSFVVMRENGQ